MISVCVSNVNYVSLCTICLFRSFFFCFCVFLFNSIKHFFFAVRCFPLCSKHFSAFFNIPFSCWCILEYKHHTPHIHNGPGVLLSGVERGEVNWKCYSQTLPNTHISICTLKSHWKNVPNDRTSEWKSNKSTKTKIYRIRKENVFGRNVNNNNTREQTKKKTQLSEVNNKGVSLFRSYMLLSVWFKYCCCCYCCCWLGKLFKFNTKN